MHMTPQPSHTDEFNVPDGRDCAAFNVEKRKRVHKRKATGCELVGHVPRSTCGYSLSTEKQTILNGRVSSDIRHRIDGFAIAICADPSTAFAPLRCACHPYSAWISKSFSLSCGWYSHANEQRDGAKASHQRNQGRPRTGYQ